MNENPETKFSAEWLPMDTAPKDGSEFDAWEFCDGHIGNRQTNVFWGRRSWEEDEPEGWVFTVDGSYNYAAHPAYWMPKPMPPLCVRELFPADKMTAYTG